MLIPISSTNFLVILSAVSSLGTSGLTKSKDPYPRQT